MADGMVSRLNQVLYAAADERRLQSALLMPSGTGPFSARSGRRPGSGLQVTTATAGSTEVVRVSAGAGVIYDASYDAHGPFVFELPAQVQKTLTARPGAGLSRRDLIVARIADPDIGTGSARELVIEIVQGSAASSPSRPTLPPLAMELAEITVPATGNLSVTQTTARTVAAGGVLPVPTIAARDALPSPYAGLTVYVEADDTIYVRGTSAWKRYTFEESGSISVSGAWTPASGSPPSWMRIGSMVYLSGAAIRSSAVPDSSYMTLVGIPTPADPSAWAGVVANGDGRVLAARLTQSDSRLTWYQKIGTGSSTYIWFSSIQYRV